MGILILASLVMLTIGLFSSGLSAIRQSALFAAAAVFGILARIAQAAKQHSQVMNRR
jgi:predicted cation transporter